MSSTVKKIILSDIQEEILEGKVCPYCYMESQYIDSSEYYSNGVSYGMIYICKPCDAIVGVHKGTDKALGRLADPTLRKYKKEAHKYFDIIWKDGHLKRSEAYEKLAEHLNLPKEYTHIGMFSVKTCEEVIDWSKMVLNDLRRLDLDFGLKVDRPHYERNFTKNE